MRVRMLKQYNQSVDGKALPEPGGEIDINPATFGVLLVKLGVAEVVPDKPAPKAEAPAAKRSTASKKPKETR